MRRAVLLTLAYLSTICATLVKAQGRFSTIIVDEQSYEAYLNEVVGLPDGGFVMLGTALSEGTDIYSAQRVAFAQRHSVSGELLWRQTFNTLGRTDRATRAQVVGEEVFVGVHTDAPRNEAQPVHLWRLRLGDGGEISRTPLIHTDQTDTLGGIYSFAVVDDAVVIERPVLNWASGNKQYSNGLYTFGLDGRARGAVKSYDLTVRSVASLADHSVYVPGNQTYRVRANGTVSELPQAQHNSDHTFDERRVVALGEYVVYVEARANNVAKRFVVVKSDGKNVTVGTKEFPEALWGTVTYDLVPYGVDSFTLTTFDELAGAYGLHVFSKTGDYGRALPLQDSDLAAPRRYEGRLYYTVAESPEGPPQRRHVLKSSAGVLPASVVNVVTGDTLARAPFFGTPTSGLDDVRNVTFGGGGTYVGVRSTPGGDRFVRFDGSGTELATAPGALDLAAARTRIDRLWSRGQDGYVALGRAATGISAFYLLGEDLSLRSTLPLDPLARGRVVTAVDPRGGFVYGWIEGLAIRLGRVDRDGQATELPTEYLYAAEDANLTIEYLTVGPGGEIALTGSGFSFQAGRFGVLLERDAAGETRLSLGSCFNCPYVAQIPVYTPDGRPAFVEPNGGKYEIYDTSPDGYFEVATRGQLYAREVSVVDVVFVSGDSLLTSTTVTDTKGFTSAEIGYVEISSGNTSRLHRTEGNNYTYGRLQVSPSRDLIQHVSIASAYTAIVVGKPDGTVGIRQVSPVSNRLHVQNPARESLAFRYASPSGTDETPHNLYLVDAAGRQIGLPPPDALGDDRYRVALDASLAAGTYALVVDGAAAPVVVQR